MLSAWKQTEVKAVGHRAGQCRPMLPAQQEAIAMLETILNVGRSQNVLQADGWLRSHASFAGMLSCSAGLDCFAAWRREVNTTGVLKRERPSIQVRKGTTAFDIVMQDRLKLEIEGALTGKESGPWR